MSMQKLPAARNQKKIPLFYWWQASNVLSLCSSVVKMRYDSHFSQGTQDKTSRFCQLCFAPSRIPQISSSCSQLRCLSLYCFFFEFSRAFFIVIQATSPALYLHPSLASSIHICNLEKHLLSLFIVVYRSIIQMHLSIFMLSIFTVVSYIRNAITNRSASQPTTEPKCSRTKYTWLCYAKGLIQKAFNQFTSKSMINWGK